MIGYPIETLVFHESFAASPPLCLEVVAACCWVGFRLVPPPTVSLENLVIGCKRLPQFREAKRSSLRREMRWHFRGTRVRAFGDEFGVAGFRARWESDAALRRTAREHPAFGKWQAGLLESLRAQPLVAMAAEGTRVCYGQIKGDAATLAAMHRFMEEGGI